MDFLKNIRYPGRFIIIGKDGDYFVVIYGATGRSVSSLNRKFIKGVNQIAMVQTSVGGNPELLSYPAVCFYEHDIIIANGRQIKSVNLFSKKTAHQQLIEDLADETYEPDENKTPRITGCYFETPQGVSAGLHIVRSDGVDAKSVAWDVPLMPGKGQYISTYKGDDVQPAPSFVGEPISTRLAFGSPEIAAKSIFDLLAPPVGEPDYRVGVVACYKRLTEEPKVVILNKKD